jgi:homocysteine S-methyltransferase
VAISTDDFNARIADGEVIVIDGGTGSELEARGVPMHPVAWSALAAADQADVARAVHEDYILAGAEVIIANTFAANRLALEPAGLGERVAELNRKAVEVAVQARDNVAERPVLIAGSLTPLSAVGIPDPAPEPDEVMSCFAEQVAIQADAGVDLFALEMIPSVFYGRPAARAAADTGLPVWLGMTTAGEWPDQTDLGRLVDELVGPGVVAINAMHSEIEAIVPALAEIERHWDGALGAYAHHGDWIPPNWIFKDVTPEQYGAAAQSWVARGAQIVGGCCGIGPAHIRALKEMLPTRVADDVRRRSAR